LVEFIDQIIKVARQHGYNPVVGDIKKKQEQWLSWYRGDVNGFHTFKQKINGNYKNFERKTLNMPKKICEDYRSLIWNERCEIRIESEEGRKAWDKVAAANNFDNEFGNLLELSFATGMGYIVEYIYMNETKINFIPYNNALPLEYDNGEIKALLTIDFEQGQNEYITHLTYHAFEDDLFVVKHEYYVSKDEKKLGQLTPSKVKDKKLKEEYKFDVKHPFFQVIKPNNANQHDITSPYGVSVYSTMLDYFMVADTLFDAMQNETVNNKTRIIVDGRMLKTKMQTNDETGDVQYINYFDDQDTAIMAMAYDDEITAGQNTKAVEYFQGELRLDQIKIGLENAVKFIGFRAGLGKNYYSFDDANVYQNEKNVITTNNDTYKTKKKHEMSIGKAIKGIVLGVLQSEVVAGNLSEMVDEKDIDIIFDDSIAIDDEAIEQKYMTLVSKGFLAPYRLVMQMLKVSEEEAKQLVAEGTEWMNERNKDYLDIYDEDEIGQDGGEDGQE